MKQNKILKRADKIKNPVFIKSPKKYNTEELKIKLEEKIKDMENIYDF